jgi:hypothetical protein
MIGAIPNPKKTLSIDFPLSKVKETVVLITNTTDKKYKLTSKNEILNLFTFEALEFLSLGVFIDVSLSSVSETKTQIEIEVRRKVGAFDKSYEVTKANEHITKVLELISMAVVLTDEQIEKQKANIASIAPEKKGCMVTIIVIVGGLGLGSLLMSFV